MAAPSGKSTGRRSPSGRLLMPIAVVVLVVLVPLTVFLGTTWLQGRSLQLVHTGSMEPMYPVDSALVVEPVEPADVRVGSVIAFEDPTRPGRLVSHRVIEVLERPEGNFFRTKGDANATADPFPVPGTAVRGRVVWSVPKLGWVLLQLEWPRGFVVLVGLPAIALVISELRHRRRQAVADTRRAVPELSGAHA